MRCYVKSLAIYPLPDWVQLSVANKQFFDVANGAMSQPYRLIAQVAVSTKPSQPKRQKSALGLRRYQEG
jgi:hypothetical protein